MLLKKIVDTPAYDRLCEIFPSLDFDESEFSPPPAYLKRYLNCMNEISPLKKEMIINERMQKLKKLCVRIILVAFTLSIMIIALAVLGIGTGMFLYFY
ncbi:MAG: hypothetical protein KDK55_02355 [Chlamydiia bacterium]|nr:hypothetical protein [Chlamydiia bacterium]